MRLDIGFVRAEELERAIDRQALDDVHKLAAAVVAPAGIPFGVLIGQLRALGFQHCGAGVVFGGDHFQPLLLAAAFPLNRFPDFQILLFENVH